MVNADTSSRAETKGRSHRQIDARDPGAAVGATRQTAILCCPRVTAAGRSPGGGVGILGR